VRRDQPSHRPIEFGSGSRAGGIYGGQIIQTEQRGPDDRRAR
jgi:hypothetical protein